MTLRERHGITAVLSYFMAWCVVGSPAITTNLFSPAGFALVAAIGTPVALVGCLLNVRAEQQDAAKKA